MKRAESQIPKLSKEVILESSKLSNAAARFVVQEYYNQQEARKRADMQLRHLGDGATNMLVATLEKYGNDYAILEGHVSRSLKVFAEASLIGRWCMAQHGVGHIIAAGLIAHIDIERAETAGQLWRFAGMDPTCKWEKGKKRPYNPSMKQLCFHMGESFKKTHNHPDAFYGAFWKERKDMLVERNEAGHNAERAKGYYTTSAEVKKTLVTGKLPAGNIDRQACNITAKLFLSHLHAVMYWDYFNRPPPKPFAISILGHAHEIRIPRTDLFPGFEDAYYGGRAMMAAE